MASNTDASPLQRPASPTGGSPRGPSTTSLQAAATVNAGLHRELSPRSSSSSLTRGHRSSSNAGGGRRRSNVLMNLQLNDPTVPAPGEMVAEHGGVIPPQHHRAPSLGELHQELEAEQEAHVNRLLLMIRQQQLELQRLQASNPNNNNNHGGEDSSAVSDRPAPLPIPYGGGPTPPLGSSYPRSPVFHHRPSLDMARADLHRRSRTPSRGASPRLRSTSISAESGDWMLGGGGGRDESAFYQAEAQMLTRENQMLKHRIHDLQKQLSELSASQGANEPPTPSGLVRSTSVSDPAAADPAEADA